MSAAPSPGSRRSALLLQGPVLPTLLRLAAPNLLVMLAQAAANFLESYYVGLLGVDALAGAALVFPLVMLMQMMSAGGIGGGISSAIARAVGSGDHERARALALHALVLAVTFGALFGAAAILGGRTLYAFMGGRGAALEAALAYSNVIFAGSIFLWVLNAMASILRGTGNMLLPAVVLTMGVLVLLVGSPLLIFGMGPLPALGIAGAGLAFVLYYVLGCLVLGASLLRGHAGWRPSPRTPLRRALFGDILAVGAPGVLNTLLSNMAVIAATTLVAHKGAHALAGFGLGIRLEYLQIPIVFGFGTGMVAMIGMNVGAGQLARARRIAWTGAAIAAGVTGTVGLAAAFFPHAWLGLFTSDAQAMETGARYLRIVAPAYSLFGLGLALYFASQGARLMKWAVLAGIARVALIALAGGAVMYAGSNLTAFCWVLVLGMAVSAALNAVPRIYRPRGLTPQGRKPTLAAGVELEAHRTDTHATRPL